MKQASKLITLTFTEYEQYPDKWSNDEVCFHTSDGRWITAEELDDDLTVALREVYESMKEGDTLQITLRVQSPGARVRRHS